MNQKFGSSLVWRMCVLIMLSLAAFAFVGYRLILVPAINEHARVEMSGSSQRVQSKIENYFSGVETSLRTSGKWAIDTQTKPTAASLRNFISVFIPVLQNQMGTLILFSQIETGRIIRLSRSDEGQIVTRLGDPETLGQSLDLATWSPEGQLLKREVRKVGADLRTRQWFQDAMAQSGTAGVFWTNPFESFPSKAPVVSGFCIGWAPTVSDTSSPIQWLYSSCLISHPMFILPSMENSSIGRSRSTPGVAETK